VNKIINSNGELGTVSPVPMPKTTETNSLPDEQVAACWDRFKQNHEAASQAFSHTVINGIEIVRLKLLLPHRQFSRQAREQIPDIGLRTIRRYRQIGEWYLSAAHGDVLTVRKLREQEAQPQPELCSETAVAAYLEASDLDTAEDLQRHAQEKVAALKSLSGTPRNRVKNLLKTVRRCWSRMSASQKEDFATAFEELKNRPARPVPTSPSASAGTPTTEKAS
jgi:hypothetical protein